MPESLELRAATHFGLQTEPRTSITLGEGRVIVVAERLGRKVFAYYDERDHLRASYKLLTDRQRAALVDALGGADA